jgi:ubiquinone/menaquinone biosynthesis C-methylase UbiE
VSAETEEWYRRYYREKGKDRNDLLRNPGVLFQHLAFQVALIAALRASSLDPSARVLDVGCGDGASLSLFSQLGFADLYGIDVQADRIESARKRFPNVQFTCDDAARMPFPSEMFDLVFESTMFVQITDEALAERIASEMLRVTRHGAYVMLIDWRYGKPGNARYIALSRRRIQRLFPAEIVCQRSAALAPPIGRFLSTYLPSAYFVVRALLPFLTASQVTLLRKS